MMAAIRRLFTIKPAPTFRDVEPAPRDAVIEQKIKAAQADLVGDMLKLERTSWEIRQELAGNVISIVSGAQP